MVKSIFHLVEFCGVPAKSPVVGGEAPGATVLSGEDGWSVSANPNS